MGISSFLLEAISRSMLPSLFFHSQLKEPAHSAITADTYIFFMLAAPAFERKQRRDW